MRELLNVRIIFFIVTIVLVTGCYGKENNNFVQEPLNSTTNAALDPFETDQKNTVIMGSMGHSFINLPLDEKAQVLPFQYNGGEMNIDYSVSASGKAKNVGFLVFIDGIPQPYKLNSTEASYEYMHIFDLVEDDKDTPFTFVFTPITGKKGDTLHISITSMYNPGFKPDMKESSSYGGYHETLETGASLVFHKDAEKFEFSSNLQQNFLSNIEISTELVTEELLENNNSPKKLTMEDLSKRVFTEILIDHEKRDANLKVNKSGTLHVTFKMYGIPGVRYKNTFYINHKALTYKDITSFETSLSEGNVSVIDADIDLENIEDFSTFYVVSTPMNADDFPNEVIILSKTPSLLLYKE